MEIFDWDILNNNWFVIGVVAVIVTPIVLAILNELILSLGGTRSEITKPLRSVRNIVLPLVAALFIMLGMLNMERSDIMVKVIETCIWIIVINAAISIINALFFTAKDNRAKAPQLFLDISRVVLVLVGVAIVFSTVWGADLGNLITALGLGSFVLGLALQDTLGNLFSGIALVYEKPFTEGDIIEVDGERGRVVAMNWRAVRILTRDKELIVIPHLMIGQSKIKNHSQPSNTYIERIVLGFSYDNPPNRVKEALMHTCLTTPGILTEPYPEVKTYEYNSSSIDYEVEFAIDGLTEHEEIRDRFMSRIWYTAYRSGLEIPYPQRVVHNISELPKADDLQKDDLHQSLQQLPKMLPIDKVRVEQLAQTSEIVYFGKDERIIRVGDKTDSLFVITEGKAIMEGRDRRTGEMVELAQLSSGDFFGEISLFSAKKSTVSIKAISDMKMIRIHADEVINMVHHNPQLARQLEDMMDLQRGART